MQTKSKSAKIMRIYEDILQKIQSKTYQPHSKLPTEYELMQQYGVARGTIRNALQMLSQDGYIQKIQGKGSVVLDIHQQYKFPISGIVSFKEISKTMGGNPKTILQELSMLRADPAIRTELNLPDDAEVWKVIRSRVIDGERIILDTDYFNREYVPYLSKEICEDSIYEYLEQELNLSISFAKKEIVVETPTETDRMYLDIDCFSNIVVVKNHVYLDDVTLFQYSESRHRPDKFRFVDFARRIH